MPVKRHHVRPEVPAVIFQWGGSARRGGGAACSQASGTASETEYVKAAEEMRGDWEGQGAVWGTSVRSEAERESGARGGRTCPAVDKGVRDRDNPLALLLVSLSCVRHRAEGFSWMLGTAARQWGAWDPGEMRRGAGFQELPDVRPPFPAGFSWGPLSLFPPPSTVGSQADCREGLLTPGSPWD